MLKHLKRFERYAFVVFLAISVGAFAYGVWLAMTGQPSAAKWLATSGLLATATGVFQLEVSGLIEKILDRYGDETRYPRGPPSYITRQIVDDADRPIRTWIRDVAFFTPKTGFWLVIIGTLVELWAVWV